MNEKLKISPPNAKLASLQVESLSLLSGYTCPFASACSAKVDKKTHRIIDGPDTVFRCFSASQEAAFSSVFRQRAHNTRLLQSCTSAGEMTALLSRSIRRGLDPFRIHVAGDFFSQKYFDSWIAYAEENPYRTFYAYTKSLIYWVNRLPEIPANLVLTASHGGRNDDLIQRYGLRSAVVVSHPSEARRLGLEIDHDDSRAISNGGPFALLLHGAQPAGSESSRAIKQMNREQIRYQYSKAAA